MRANMDYETLRSSMTVQDAARILEETDCCGTMDIAKNVILKVLDEQMSHSEKPNKWINKPQPSENLNVVLDELNRIGRNAFKDDTDYDNLFDFISNLPNVKPQPSERTEERTETHACDCINGKGHWIEHKHGGIEHIECSKCRCWFLRKDLIRNTYCPNCGSYNGGTK